MLFIVAFTATAQLVGCTTYYNPLGFIKFLPLISSKIEVEKLLDIMAPILLERKCKLIYDAAYMHPTGYAFMYTYDCGKNVYVSLKTEEISFYYQIGGDSIESKTRPENNEWYGLFVRIQTELDENWGEIIEIKQHKPMPDPA